MASRNGVLLTFVFLVAVMALTVAARINPCDVHRWDELSGAPQDDPDRPCHVHYNKITSIKKRRLVLQRQMAARLEPATAGAGGEEASTTVPDAATAPVTTTAVSGTTQLTLHSSSSWTGDLLVNTTIQAIFWGKSWSDPTFVGDKITGMSQFYTAHNKSRYADTCSEYAGHSSTRPTSTTTYLGFVLDTSSTTNLNPNSVSAIGSKVCAKATKIVAGGYYPVFVDYLSNSQTWCGWHSYGYCKNGLYRSSSATGYTRVTFSVHLNMDSDAGCQVGDTTTGHSVGLAALASVAAHELEETRTDPYMSGYYDASGAENGDKCAWTFNRIVSLADGSHWKLQGEWSNAAYLAGTGYDTYKGCIDGA